MNFVQYMLAFLVLYLCAYALINRVCQCIEHCATARAYSKFRENGNFSRNPRECTKNFRKMLIL